MKKQVAIDLFLTVEGDKAVMTDEIGAVVKELPTKNGYALEVFGKSATLYTPFEDDLFGPTEELTKLFNAA